MTTHKRNNVGLHYEKQTESAIDLFMEVRGMGATLIELMDAYAERRAFIASLPTVNWKGRTLYTLRCNGTTGRGPHDVNVPPSLLWCLIEPRAYRCQFHANREVQEAQS